MTSFNKKTRKKGRVIDENMKKYNEDDLNYFIMCRLYFRCLLSRENLNSTFSASYITFDVLN